MPSPFVHLHAHSEYSILDGACRIRDLVTRAAELEMPAVAVTDHGSMAGSVELYRAARGSGVKPVLGCEVYVVSDRSQKEAATTRSWAHLTLLAETTEGYHNLVRLVTRGYLEGYHYKPRVDLELMAEYGAGLIALSGCLSSRVNQALLAADERKARAALDDLVQIYGRDQVYLEIQDAGLEEHHTVNAGLLKLADETGLRPVASGDVHYLRAEDADPHDILLCIQTGNRLSDEKRLRFANKEFFFKTAEEMRRDFAAYGDRDLFAPTLEIAERCNVELELDALRLPRFPVPDGEDAFAFLERLCRDGLARRYGQADAALEQRLAFELQTIREMGFADYFLIVWDFVDFAKRNGIGVGPGRGSAAGSLVAYCLAITDVDPIRYELLFERFLNPGRKSMPDIDIDFSVDGRERVLNYVVEKYGRERVAQIITFGKLAAKAATRDTGRVLGLPFDAVDRIAKLIPDGPKVGFSDAMAAGQELRRAYDANEPIGSGPDGRIVTVTELVDMARPLEGLVRQDSIHAAAVVIGDQPLVEYLPLQRKGAGAELVTQYAMGDVEALGLLKMDFLGLRNLDVIDEAVRLIHANGTELDLVALPLDDAPTYAMLARGDATGVFQFESTGMREALRQVGPTEFEDLIALVALYRPGPMANIPVYAARKQGREPISYTDPRLESILASTKGVYIYQEQAMQIAKDLAGFSPAEADDLRKAIGKKKRDLMDSLRSRFMDGCAANGVAAEVATRLWEENERSADYSFNKAHAACYALIAYRTAYLKANHPAEYMAALISSVMDTKDRVPFYVTECNDMGIEVLPPDVNASQRDFAVVGGQIRFGLSAVKNVGDTAVRAMLGSREADGPFTSLFDLCERVDPLHLNARVVESLIRAGALDSTGATRKGMLDVLEQALTLGRTAHQDRAAGQFNLFGDGAVDGGAGVTVSYPPLATDELDQRALMSGERETLGLFLTSHPLTDVKDQLRRKTDCTLRDVPQLDANREVTIGGLVSSVNARPTRKGDMMAFVTLEDLTGSVEVLVFARAFEQCRPLLELDRIVIVKGKMRERGGDEKRLFVDEMHPFEAIPERRTVRLSIDARRVGADAVRDLRRVVEQHPGEHAVEVELATSFGSRRLRLGPQFRVAADSAFFAEVRARFGECQLA